MPQAQQCNNISKRKALKTEAGIRDYNALCLSSHDFGHIKPKCQERFETDLLLD